MATLGELIRLIEAVTEVTAVLASKQVKDPTGLLRATTNGPTKDNLMQVRGTDLEKLNTYSDWVASDA
jgi:hypothetical protein